MPNYVDLHMHSTASDGLYSPTELMHHAKEAGLRVVALTDHDTTEWYRRGDANCASVGYRIHSWYRNQ